MTLWFRTRRVHWWSVTIVATVLIGLYCGDRSLSLPSIFGIGGSNAFIETFLPLPWVAASADGLAGRIQAIEARPALLPRGRISRLAAIDTGWLAVQTVVACGVFAFLLTPPGGSAGYVAPVLVLSGLTAVVTLLGGPGLAVFCASALVMFSSLWAMNAPAARYLRILEPDGSHWWAATWGVLWCGLAALMLLTDRVNTRLSRAEGIE